MTMDIKKLTVKCLFWLLILCSLSALANEEYSDKNTRSQQKEFAAINVKQVKKVVEKYNSALGCNFYADKNKMAPYMVEGDVSYVALVELDKHCYGGTKSIEYYIAVVQFGVGNTAVVNDEISKYDGNFPASISKFYRKNDRIVFEGESPDYSQIGHCCAAIKQTGYIDFDHKKRLWRIVYD